ncbi:MAG TPA: carbohydrate kinase [Nocardioidaceae bacterium]|nr:carbohydrate kinase [Nocardioidaceae bacterium]
MAVLVVGESLVDVVVGADGEEIDTRPGGAPLNVAVGLARLDVDSCLLTAFADDEHGAVLARHIRDSGVRLLGAGSSTQPTSVARAVLDARQHATYEFALHWDPGRVDLPADLDALHVGSLGTVVGPGDQVVRSLVAQARAAGVPVTYDPNVRPAVSTDAAVAWAGVRRWAAAADVVKMSDDDAAYLRPGRSVDDLLDAMLSAGAALAVLTQGADGTLLATATARVHRPAPPVDVVDTVGAGDSFMAGLITALLDHDLLRTDRLARLSERELTEVGDWAAGVAAITCSRRGADPPWRADLGA